MQNLPYFLKRLVLDASADERTVKRAYARELKLIDQEEDPADFQALREAYEAALKWVQRPTAQEAVQADPSVAHTQDGGQGPMNFGVPRVPVQFGHVLKTHQLDSAVDNIEMEFDSKRLADDIFLEFLACCEELVSSGRLATDLPWRSALRRFLNDARLDNLLARDLFERLVANLLVSGWRPGHEALFGAAVKIFNWAEDGRRLIYLGHVGDRLNRAINERVIFNRQTGSNSDKQRKLIARLRDSNLPSNHELIMNMPILGQLTDNFPNWMSIITSADNILQWRQLSKEIPQWQRQLHFQSAKPKALKPVPVSKSSGGWSWKFVVLMAIIAGLRGIGGMSTPAPVPPLTSPPLESHQQTRQSSYLPLSPSEIIGERVKSNIRYEVPANLFGNPPVEFEMELYTSGIIKKTDKLKSSGLLGFDDAVLMAIKRTQPFPSEIPRKFIFIARPKDK